MSLYIPRSRIVSGKIFKRLIQGMSGNFLQWDRFFVWDVCSRRW